MLIHCSTEGISELQNGSHLASTHLHQLLLTQGYWQNTVPRIKSLEVYLPRLSRLHNTPIISFCTNPQQREST